MMSHEYDTLVIRYYKPNEVKEHLAKITLSIKDSLLRAIDNFIKYDCSKIKNPPVIEVLPNFPRQDMILIAVFEIDKEWRHVFGKGLRKRYNYPDNCLLNGYLIEFLPLSEILD